MLVAVGDNRAKRLKQKRSVSLDDEVLYWEIR